MFYTVMRILNLNGNHNSCVWWHMTSWQPYLKILNLICAYGDHWKVYFVVRFPLKYPKKFRKISISTQQLANIIPKDVFLKPNLNVDMFYYVDLTKDDRLSNGVIVAIAVGYGLMFIVFVVLICYCCKHGKCDRCK